MSGWLTPGLPVLTSDKVTGAELSEFDTQLANGQSPQSAAISTFTLMAGVQTVAAAGATQGNATAITAGAALVFVTVTASTEGVKLPVSPNKGDRYLVIADPAVGAKVYPGTNGLIGAASTNASYALVKNTTTMFIAFSATKWRIDKGS